LQRWVRKSVLEAVEQHENGAELLRAACLAHLHDGDPGVVVRALSCLFAIGTPSDLSAVESLLQHAEESVRKAARTCEFEIRHREPEA